MGLWIGKGMNGRVARRIILAAALFGAAVFPLAAQDEDAPGNIETPGNDSPYESEDGSRYENDGDDPYENGSDGQYEDDDDNMYEGEDGDGNATLPTLPAWDGVPLTGYTRGDQTFNISLGILVPLFFVSSSGRTLDNNLHLGGTGSLSYNYFLNSRIYIGGSLQGSFSQTLGKNFLYMIPIGATLGYQFVFRRFEFPLSVTVGGVTVQYLTYNGYWFFLKPQASGFFRFNSDWSFGLNLAWWFTPQSTNTPEKNATGHFFEVTLSARYHF
ncbi:MAG: hypothetical protein LBH50_04035 [Spirochaetaceae bacterium]|jgi:hypothetical protein|nr:hypothetical protein [Spirochaetaceae bacterium]